MHLKHRRSPRPLRKFLAAFALFGGVIFIALAPSARPSFAETKIDLMGNWTVDPFKWRTSGCLYEQWVVIKKRTGANTYAGVSRQRHSCFGDQGGISETQLVVTVQGKNVILTSPSPTWNKEVLLYISPYRMDGKDSLGHRMIYRRPKGPPGV